MNEKERTISLITLGHIDHGKSSTMGHFLFEIGAVDQRTMDRLDAESQELKRSSWKWAYVLDSTEEERRGGITSDIAFQPFSVDERNFMLIDAPGHRDYVKNAIQGAVLADACVVLVSAVPNDLRSGLKVGTGSMDPGGQTREHCILGSVLGISQVFFLINKMDLVNYSEKSFNDAAKQIIDLLKEIQSPWDKLLHENSFIPISGLQGDNLTKKSENMQWWTGPTLAESFKSFKSVTKENKVTRFLTHDAFEMPGIGTVLHGRLIAGSLVNEQKVTVLPAKKNTEVKDIWNVSFEPIKSLKIGDYGLIQLKSVDKEHLIPGIIVADSTNHPIVSKTITIRVLLLTSTEKPLIPGSNIILHVGMSHTSVRIENILKIERSKKKRNINKKIMLVFPGELAVIEIKPELPIIVEKFSDQPILGRAVLRKEGSTIAVGVIKDFN